MNEEKPTLYKTHYDKTHHTASLSDSSIKDRKKKEKHAYLYIAFDKRSDEDTTIAFQKNKFTKKQVKEQYFLMTNVRFRYIGIIKIKANIYQHHLLAKNEINHSYRMDN